MTFFEQELRKIVASNYPNATFVGRACFVPLSDMNRAKIQFTTCGYADHYEALQLTVLNRNDGQVDSMLLHFKDVLGKKKVSNPNFREGINPHAWTYGDKTEWYCYQPNNQDYQLLSKAVSSYLSVFRAPEREANKEEDYFMIHRPSLGRNTISTPGNIITITVYKDDLGFPEKDDLGDNLTEISVPKVWLVNKLLESGESLTSWLEGPPDDNIAEASIREGVILDCSDPEIKAALFTVKSPSLDNIIDNAHSRALVPETPTSANGKEPVR